MDDLCSATTTIIHLRLNFIVSKVRQVFCVIAREGVDIDYSFLLVNCFKKCCNNDFVFASSVLIAYIIRFE